MELIETLWNVNTISPSVGSSGTGINRNIVECKCNGDVLTWESETPELIETLWNVN